MDLLAKIANFSPPHSHSAPPLPMFPLAFCAEVNHERIRGLFSALEADFSALMRYINSRFTYTHLYSAAVVLSCARHFC